MDGGREKADQKGLANGSAILIFRLNFKLSQLKPVGTEGQMVSTP